MKICQRCKEPISQEFRGVAFCTEDSIAVKRMHESMAICLKALGAALRRKELLANQLYEACKEARDLIRMRCHWAGIGSETPLMAELKLAISAAEQDYP